MKRAILISILILNCTIYARCDGSINIRFVYPKPVPQRQTSYAEVKAIEEIKEIKRIVMEQERKAIIEAEKKRIVQIEEEKKAKAAQKEKNNINIDDVLMEALSPKKNQTEQDNKKTKAKKDMDELVKKAIDVLREEKRQSVSF